MKILSPAGNLQCLKAAVNNGADEVYLGINQFNARNNVDGFTIDSLSEAVDFAHIFGVKVNLAINILFTDEEIFDAVKTVVKAYNLGVDAFIVQDLGLADILSRDYPEIELHASTQMGIHNREGVKAIEKFNFKRVVLARETPLEEIKRIRENSSIEIEYFIQGALCVSFSGNCYLSSYMLSASGNRGRCKQLCRLPYRLEKDGKILKNGYLLSAKDFNMSSRLKDLESAGVDVLKIEGRARRPFYVATATREYYKALNGLYADQKQLELAFNRGFTAGYFDGNGKIISDIQGHVGVYCGKISKVKGGKTFNEAFILTDKELNPKSTFKVFNGEKERCVLTLYDLTKVSGGYRFTTTQNVCAGDTLNLIVDANGEKAAELFTRKKNIEIELFLLKGEKIKAVLDVDGVKKSVEGEILDEALKQPISKEELETNFKKSDIFNPTIFVRSLEPVFITKKQLNEFRREVFKTAFEMLCAPYRKNITVKSLLKPIAPQSFGDFVFVDKIQSFTAKNVIYSPEEYNLIDVQNFIKECEKQGKTAYLDTPNFALKEDVELIKDIIDKTGVKIVANNYYALSLDNARVIGGGLNVYNTYSAAAHKKPFIVAEDGGIGNKQAFPYMTLRHCPMKAHLNANCNKCTYTDGYNYVMESGKRLKLKRKKLTSCTFYLTD